MNQLMSPAARSTWQLTDLFLLSDWEEVRLKNLIAQQLGIRYGGTNHDKPFAEACGRIKPFAIDRIVNARATYHALLRNHDLCGSARKRALEHFSNVSMTVSGCLIKWKPRLLINKGYILRCMHVYMTKWDSSIERLAAFDDQVGALLNGSQLVHAHHIFS